MSGSSCPQRGSNAGPLALEASTLTTALLWLILITQFDRHSLMDDAQRARDSLFIQRCINANATSATLYKRHVQLGVFCGTQ